MSINVTEFIQLCKTLEEAWLICLITQQPLHIRTRAAKVAFEDCQSKPVELNNKFLLVPADSISPFESSERTLRIQNNGAPIHVGCNADSQARHAELLYQHKHFIYFEMKGVCESTLETRRRLAYSVRTNLNPHEVMELLNHIGASSKFSSENIAKMREDAENISKRFSRYAAHKLNLAVDATRRRSDEWNACRKTGVKTFMLGLGLGAAAIELPEYCSARAAIFNRGLVYCDLEATFAHAVAHRLEGITTPHAEGDLERELEKVISWAINSGEPNAFARQVLRA